MQLVRAAGQLLRVENIPQNAQVRVNGNVVVPNGEGLYALQVGQVSDVVVSEGDREVFRASVPATDTGVTRTITIPAPPPPAPNVQGRPPRSAPPEVQTGLYAPGTEDDMRNRAIKGKTAMSLFGIGAGIGAIVAIVKLAKE
jgi:hypothetical protein